MKKLKTGLLILVSVIPSLAFSIDNFHYSRTYSANEKFGYSLTTLAQQNGQFDSEETAESQHRVLKGSIPSEEIVWTSLLKKDANGTVDLSDDAKKVAPYQISLDPKGTLAIPSLNVPKMVGMITDLNTFYVAISDAIGIQRISKQGDVYENPNELKGNWADGVNTIVGQDCTKATLSLLVLKQDVAVVKSEFLAPSSECISMHKPWMKLPVKDGVPNNIQQVRKNGDSYMVMWGHEQFIITSYIDRSSGIIKEATMDNTLTLKMKVGCDSDLENCQSEFSLTIQRDERLQLKR